MQGHGPKGPFICGEVMVGRILMTMQASGKESTRRGKKKDTILNINNHVVKEGKCEVHHHYHYQGNGNGK